MSNKFMPTQTQLCTLINRKFCHFSGRGAAALFGTLQVLKKRTGKRNHVLMPSILCASPANVTLYAELVPVFADIDLKNFNLSFESVVKTIESDPQISIVIVPHVYGLAAPIVEIINYCKPKNIFVIEDAAQGLGGSIAGQPMGSFGDVSILSFGHTKLLDTGWNGAALTNDPDLSAELAEVLSGFPECPTNIDAMYGSYRKKYYDLWNKSRSISSNDKLFFSLPNDLRAMHIFCAQSKYIELVANNLQNISSEKKQRLLRARKYEKQLREQSELSFALIKDSDVPWRFSFLAPQRSEHLIAALRTAKIDASSWYPPLHLWYEYGATQDRKNLANAEYLGKNIVNLWVDGKATPAYIDQACSIIKNQLAKNSDKTN